MNRRQRSVGFGFLVGLGLSATQAYADDPSDLEGLLGQSIVTTASKTAETDTASPAVSRVITADELRMYGLNGSGNVDSAATFLVPEIFGSDSKGSRGVNLDNPAEILVLLNGHALNNPYRGVGLVGLIPIEMVDRIEVVIGPGSVLYGSNATLAVMNIITKDARNFDGTRVGMSWDVPGGVRPYVGVGQSFRLFGSDGEVTWEAQYFRQRGPDIDIPAEHVGIDPGTGQLARFSSNPVGTGVWGGAPFTHNDANEPSGLMHLRLGEFTMTAFGIATHDALPVGAGQDFNGYGYEDEHQLALDLVHQRVFSRIVQLTTRAYADSVDSAITLDSSGSSTCPAASLGLTCRIANRFAARWGGVEIQPQFDWFADGRFVTLLGVDTRGRSVRAQTDESLNTSGLPLIPSLGLVDRHDVTIGAYAQQTWSPVAWINLNGGARMDYDVRFDPVVSPRAAAAFRVWPGGTAKLIYSQAFRAPTFEESYFGHPLAPAPAFLNPEHVYSREATFTQTFGGEKLSIGVFDTTYTDLIQRQQLTAAEANALVRAGLAATPPQYITANLGRIEDLGFTMDFEGEAAGGTIRHGAGFTVAQPKEVTPSVPAGTPLEQTPRLEGKAHVAWVPGGHTPTVGLIMRFYSSMPVQNAFSNAFPGIPYTTPMVNVRATVNGDVPVIPELSYRISADYTFGAPSPAVIGPVTSETPSQRAPVLNPAPRFALTLAFEKHF